jgi:glycosyltransferase involved in cell wall biosynthesis
MFEALVKPLDGHGSLEFGLNNFLDRYRSTSEELRDLHPAVRDDRVVLLTHALAASAINPKLARYLPRESCRRLLAIDRGTDQSMFERLLDFGLHGASFGSQFSGRQLQDYLEDRLARAGHEIGGHSSARPLSRAGLECFVPAGMSLDHVERGISLIGPFDAASGLGQATRMSAEVISESSLPLSIIDFSWDNPAPTGFSESRRFNPPRHPTSINLIHLNAESLPMALSHLEPRIYEHSYNIGYFFWELSELPACHFLSLNVLDEIWVASEYNREVYERAVDIPVKNVGMAVQPLTNVRHRSRAHFGLPSDTLLFLITFDSFSFIERKNPLAAIAAFHLAFPPERGEKVGLVIKTQNRYRVMDPHQVRIWSKIDHVIGLDPRIVLINETLHYEDLIALKLCCDCYVSLHRSEGLGFGMIESMQLKMPVIATSYGGNMDFMDASTAFLVDYKLIPVQRGEYIFVEPGSMWAQPDVVQASQQMLHVYADPAFARDRGEAASQAIQQNFSVDAIRGRYIRRLDEIERIIETKVS